MKWQIDKATQIAARQYPVPIKATTPASQFSGRQFNAKNWARRIRSTDKFRATSLISSPNEIIQTFQNKHYLQALALVVSWGTMWRKAKNIYNRHSLQEIHEALEKCAQDLKKTNSIETSWEVLTCYLDWSPVISSKTLHFLCRALGYTQDPPVAIDNAVVLNKVWPTFKHGIPMQQRPKCWRGKYFDAYRRYMTAVLEWAKQRRWATTDIEATLFDEYH